MMTLPFLLILLLCLKVFDNFSFYSLHVYRYVTETLQYSPWHIVVCGESIGSKLDASASLFLNTNSLENSTKIATAFTDRHPPQAACPQFTLLLSPPKKSSSGPLQPAASLSSRSPVLYQNSVDPTRAYAGGNLPKVPLMHNNSAVQRGL